MVHYLDFDEEEKLRAYLQLISPHLTPEDISNYQSDEKIALYLEPYSLTKDLFSIDLPRQLGSKFDVPIFFFTGFYDWHTPKVLSENWFSKIKTRHKKLVTFYDSSHFVFSEEPGRFLYELVHQVLPLSNDGCRDLIG
jgi:pimeloyl-ACP methyl ester carboxylesterase